MFANKMNWCQNCAKENDYLLQTHLACTSRRDYTFHNSKTVPPITASRFRSRFRFGQGQASLLSVSGRPPARRALYPSDPVGLGRRNGVRCSSVAKSIVSYQVRIRRPFQAPKIPVLYDVRPTRQGGGGASRKRRVHVSATPAGGRTLSYCSSVKSIWSIVSRVMLGAGLRKCVKFKNV